MKIISKFKDYYDHVQAYGVDDSISYVRNQVIVCDRNYYHNGGWNRETVEADIVNWDHEHFSFKELEDEERFPPIPASGRGIYTINFCGKEYYAYRASLDGKAHFIYAPDKFKALVESGYPYIPRYDVSSYISWLASNGRVDHVNINEKYKCPIIVRFSTHAGHFTIYNCRLNLVEFQKTIDPYTAYMELDMFISGVIGKTAGEMATISDKDKIDKHGFDSQYGFRTRPKEKVR